MAVPPPSTLPHEPAALQEPALVIGQLRKETVKSRSSSSLVFEVKPLELIPDSTTQPRFHVLSVPAGSAWAGRCNGKASDVEQVRHKRYRTLNLLRHQGKGPYLQEECTQRQLHITALYPLPSLQGRAESAL